MCCSPFQIHTNADHREWMPKLGCTWTAEPPICTQMSKGSRIDTFLSVKPPWPRMLLAFISNTCVNVCKWHRAAVETSAHPNRLVTRRTEKHRWQRPADSLVNLPIPQDNMMRFLVPFVVQEEKASFTNRVTHWMPPRKKPPAQVNNGSISPLLSLSQTSNYFTKAVARGDNDTRWSIRSRIQLQLSSPTLQVFRSSPVKQNFFVIQGNSCDSIRRTGTLLKCLRIVSSLRSTGSTSTIYVMNAAS